MNCPACDQPVAGTRTVGRFHRACVERLLASIVNLDEASQRRATDKGSR